MAANNPGPADDNRVTDPGHLHWEGYLSPATVELIAHRIQNLLANGRKFTAVQSCAGRTDAESDIATSLQVDHRYGDGIHVHHTPTDAGFGIRSTPGINTYSAHAYEEAGRETRPSRPYISIVGGHDPNSIGRNDRINAKWTNEHGVEMEWTIAPELITSRERAEHTATILRDAIRLLASPELAGRPAAEVLEAAAQHIGDTHGSPDLQDLTRIPGLLGL